MTNEQGFQTALDSAPVATAISHALPPMNLATSLIVCPSPQLIDITSKLAKYLQETGLEVLVRSQQEVLEEAISENTLVIARSIEWETEAHYGGLEAIDPSRRWPWLRAVLSDSYREFHIGPLFTARSVPCYQCAQKRFPPMAAGQLPALIREATLNIFAAWLAETVRRICDGTHRLTNGEFSVCKLPDMTTQYRVAIRERQCNACGCLGATVPARSTYQEAVEMIQDYFNMGASKRRSPHFHPHDHLNNGEIAATWNYDDSLLLLPYSTDDVWNRPSGLRTSLLGRDVTNLTLAEISAILRYGAGHRAVGSADALGRRWCSSAGNKGSVSLKLEVRGIPAIADGSYLYREADHALEPLLTDDFTRSQLTSQPFLSSQARDKKNLNIIPVGNYQRLYPKYGIFASKLVYLDMGVTAAQLLRVVHALDLKPIFGFAANTSRHKLAIDPLIQRGGIQIGIGPTSYFREKHVLYASEPRQPAPSSQTSFDKSSPSDIERFILSQECSNEHPWISHGTRRLWLNTLMHNRTTGKKAPRLNEVLSKRRSVRYFSGKAIPKETFLGVLKEALNLFAVYIDRPMRQSLSLLISADKIQGIDRGQYLCEVGTGEPRLTAVRMDSAPIIEGSPGFRCLVMGRSDSEIDDRRLQYGQQLILAGMLVHFMAIEAIAHCLAGSTIARGRPLKDLILKHEASTDLVLCCFICGFGALEEHNNLQEADEEYNG